jgi:hypothetical protein
MATLTFRMGRQPEFDIVSYGRRGPGRLDRFSPTQVAQIARTVRRAPEVMVKVSGGSSSPRAVAAHIGYISRRGELDIETDGGERLQGRDVAGKLVDDWDLDLDAALNRWQRLERGGRVAQPKLVHNIVLSMPAGTSPQRLLTASREFAREEFALQHRYAMVLHTDQVHPHVHLVVSAHKLDGGRLNIRKADLRRWREQFARQLRAQGVEANATPAQVRGRLSNHPKDGLYRAAQRGDARLERTGVPPAAELASNSGAPLSARRMVESAKSVQQDWLSTRAVLAQQGFSQLAMEVERFRQSIDVARSMQERPGLAPRWKRADQPPRQLELTR